MISLACGVCSSDSSRQQNSPHRKSNYVKLWSNLQLVGDLLNVHGFALHCLPWVRVALPIPCSVI